MSGFLAAEGIPILAGYAAEHITSDIDLVVVGNAISRGNAELEAVLDRSIRYASLPETIRDTFLWDAEAVVVAGTHGKTTTTALAAWVLTSGGADPSMLVGGIAKNFGQAGASYRVGRGRAFVIEGDEYDSAYFDKTAKFLKYLPDIAVVNNVEFDHADIYPDLEAVRLAFARFVHARAGPRPGAARGRQSRRGGALGRTRAAGCRRSAWRPSATWRASAAHARRRRHALRSVHGPDGVAGSFFVPMRGAHNVRNALAAVAVGPRVRVRAWRPCAPAWPPSPA